MPLPLSAPSLGCISGAPHVDVGCELRFDVDEHAELALQIAPATSAGELAAEQLDVDLDGAALGVDEVPGDHGTRIHVVRCGRGSVGVRYSATVRPAAAAGPVPVSATEAITDVRQSRYCPSDALEGFARTELAHLEHGAEHGRAIAEWVFERLLYSLGSSGPLDSAVDTLLLGRGVCRDFAHLTVALCRAAGVPARLASAYAPGLTPMDFHAVAEVGPSGTWEVVDATRLAPRQSLVRIATGRDAADTAFATTLRGSAELTFSSVTAVVDGELPVDDHRAPIALR